MKKYIILLVFALSAFSFKGPNAAIEWGFTEYDFGSVVKNKPVTVEFTFKNPGMIPLVISEVKSSCGCTVPEFPKEPILPGKTGKIIVTYDAKISGYFSKTVTVFANIAEGKSLLYIKGEVN